MTLPGTRTRKFEAAEQIAQLSGNLDMITNEQEKEAKAEFDRLASIAIPMIKHIGQLVSFYENRTQLRRELLIKLSSKLFLRENGQYLCLRESDGDIIHLSSLNLFEFLDHDIDKSLDCLLKLQKKAVTIQERTIKRNADKIRKARSRIDTLLVGPSN